MDLSVLFLGHGRLDADRAACAREPADPARRRPPPDRLRRGHAAPAAALGRPARHRARLPDPLPRRPLPRAARDDEDVRAARPRACRSRSTGRAACGADVRPAPRSTASSATRCGCAELAPSEAVELDGYRIGAYAVVAPDRGARLRAGRGRAPGPLRPGAGARARRRRRARCSGASSAARRSRRTAGRSQPDDVMGEPRPGRKLVFTGDTEPCEATVAVAQRRRAARPRRHVRRRGGRARAPDRPLDRPRRRPRSRATPASSLLALTHLSSRYFAPVIEKEAREVFERTVVPRDFDVIEVPYRERGRAGAVAGRTARARSEREHAPASADDAAASRSPPIASAPLLHSPRRFL